MYIYALQNDELANNNLIKIGKTYDIYKRLDTHNRQSYPNHKVIFSYYLDDKMYNFAENYIFNLVNNRISKNNNIPYKDHRYGGREEFPLSLEEFKLIIVEFIQTVDSSFEDEVIRNRILSEIEENKTIQLFENIKIETKTKTKIDRNKLIFTSDEKYGNIIIDKETGYINVSKVLKRINNKKYYSEFKRIEKCKKKYEYIKNKIDKEPEIKTYLNGKKDICGYYIHQDLLLYVYKWSISEY